MNTNNQRTEWIISLLILIVGAIHFTPVIGVLGNQQLLSLYAIDIAALSEHSPDAANSLLLLMRHRAMLFGIIGLFILVAAFKRPLQMWALIAAQINIFSFIALYLLSSSNDPALDKIMWADVFAQALVLVVMIIRIQQSSSKN